jgi:hypothetical protein
MLFQVMGMLDVVDWTKLQVLLDLDDFEVSSFSLVA